MATNLPNEKILIKIANLIISDANEKHIERTGKEKKWRGTAFEVREGFVLQTMVALLEKYDIEEFVRLQKEANVRGYDVDGDIPNKSIDVKMYHSYHDYVIASNNYRHTLCDFYYSVARTGNEITFLYIASKDEFTWQYVSKIDEWCCSAPIDPKRREGGRELARTKWRS